MGIKVGREINHSHCHILDTISKWHSRDEDDLKVDDLTWNIEGLNFYDSMLFIYKLMSEKMSDHKKGDRWIS